MAPARNDSPADTDTPMTDAIDDNIPSIPVDAPVGDTKNPNLGAASGASGQGHGPSKMLNHMLTPFKSLQDTPDYTVHQVLRHILKSQSTTDIPHLPGH